MSSIRGSSAGGFGCWPSLSGSGDFFGGPPPTPATPPAPPTPPIPPAAPNQPPTAASSPYCAVSHCFKSQRHVTFHSRLARRNVNQWVQILCNLPIYRLTDAGYYHFIH